MNVTYLNPVIGAATYVLREVCGMEIQTDSPYLTQMVYEETMFIVMIGITGELHGQVILSMKEAVACDVASRMMMGMPVPELNDMARSAIAELMNMTMGNAVTSFFNMGIKLDITPPTLFVSNTLTMNVGNAKMICIPITFEGDNLIELHIAIKEPDNKK